jgi:hypothetical protein
VWMLECQLLCVSTFQWCFDFKFHTLLYVNCGFYVA